MPRVVFRADASPSIGGGHLMRCLTLADALSAKGWTPAFACNDAARSVVHQLSGQVDVYCGAGDQLDAAAISRRWPEGCDLLVVDHYELGAAFESSCQGWARKVAVLDDLADRPHDCDMLIDTTFQRQAASYVALVAPHTAMLLGSAFALLRPEFAAVRASSIDERSRREDTRRVFVSLGYTDVDGITEQVVRALLASSSPFLIDVVATKSTRSWKPLAALASSDSRIAIHDNPPHIASLMAAADIAIGGGGTTSWERCTLGLPTVLLVLAENQRLIASRLEKAGAAIVVASPFSANRGPFLDAVDQLARNRKMRLEMSAAAAAIVDGRGAERVVRAILTGRHGRAPKPDQISLRQATEDDSLLIWAWRNDISSRENSIQMQPVSWMEHSCWYDLAVRDPKKLIFIASDAGDDCGVIRFDQDDGTKSVVSVIVAPDRRGKGFGTALIEKACSLIAKILPGNEVRANIKSSNTVSRHAFESCGFVRNGVNDDMLSYVLTA